jgi:lysophospholipase L1-like esterase
MQARSAAPSLPDRRPRLTPEEFYDTLRQLHKICASKGIRFILMIWPFGEQIRAGSRELEPYQRKIAQLGFDENIPVVNLVETFLQAKEPLFVDHVHANAQGCRLAAAAVAEAIKINEAPRSKKTG